jgi:hypothetical protein
VLLVEDQLLAVPFPVLLVNLTQFSLVTLASRPRNGTLSNSSVNAVKSLQSELLWVTMEELRVSLTFNSHLLMVPRKLWSSMDRSLTDVLSDLISLPQAEVDQAVAVASAAAVVASVATEAASVAVAASVVAVASVATEVASVAVAASVVAVALAAAVVALVTEVAVVVAEVSTPLTRASLFLLRTNL